MRLRFRPKGRSGSHLSSHAECARGSNGFRKKVIHESVNAGKCELRSFPTQATGASYDRRFVVGSWWPLGLHWCRALGRTRCRFSQLIGGIMRFHFITASATLLAMSCSSLWQGNQPDPRPASNQSGAEMQQQAATGGPPKTLYVIIVPLDDTGFADSRYLNPRNPPHVLAEGVEFVNRTSDRTFVVTFSLDRSRLSTREQNELKNFAAKNSDPHLRPLECEGDKCAITL